MKQLLPLPAFGLLVPSTALAQVDAEVAAQCRDARDFYGCIRAFTTPVRRSDDTAAFHDVMGQMAAGLISGPSYRNAPQTFPRGMIRLVLLEGSCGASCADPIEAADGGEVAVAEVGLSSLGVLNVASTLGHPVDVRALTKTQNVATPRERSHVITRCREGGVGRYPLNRKRLNRDLHGMFCIVVQQTM